MHVTFIRRSPVRLVLQLSHLCTSTMRHEQSAYRESTAAQLVGPTQRQASLRVMCH